MRISTRSSLRARLTVLYAAGSLGTLVLVTGLLYWTFQRELNLRNRRILEAEMLELAAVLEKSPQEVSSLVHHVQGAGANLSEPAIYLRVLGEGETLIETSGMSFYVPPSWFAGQAKTKHHKRRFALAQMAASGHVIQGALDITRDDYTVIDFRQRLTVLLLGGTLLCVGFGWWAGRRGLAPIQELAASTRGITAQKLDQRLDPQAFPDELRHLAGDMNDMLDRLDGAFSRLSQFSADLAHELRTPITNLVSESEVALSRDRSVEEYREVLESGLEELRRLARLTTEMLFLARVEDPHSAIVRRPVEAGRLVSEVLDFFEAAAEEQGLELRAISAGAALGDAELLRRALVNLVANAMDATPSGGRIEVRFQPEGERMVLTVSDTGRGLAADQIPHVMDRFYRIQESQGRRPGGIGLGLAIVHSIAKLHGGMVRITSEPGRGTQVRLDLPLA